MADELIKRADIITKANIKDAIAECDCLGRDEFLDYVNAETEVILGEYAYRLVKSRNHRLFYKGKYYDTKPIVQCAFIKAIGDDDPDRYDWGFWGGLGDRNRAAQLLIDLGFKIVSLADRRAMEQEEEADKEEQKINDDPKRSPTTKRQLIKARRGQGKYRSNLLKIEKFCRVTKVKDPAYLIASHIKPWCESNDKEKLDGNNGLLLAPHIDHLFDQGYISFTDGGKMLVADKSAGNEDLAKILELWHIDRCKNYGGFSPKQRRYLAYHRYRIYRGRVMRPRRSQR